MTGIGSFLIKNEGDLILKNRDLPPLTVGPNYKLFFTGFFDVTLGNLGNFPFLDIYFQTAPGNVFKSLKDFGN